MADVEEFARQKDLVEHIPLLRKGALVAQDPEQYGENITGPEALDEVEKVMLRDEVEHRWRMPLRLILTIVTCSIGACVQGWDQTGSNGATIFFPEEYGIAGNDRQSVMVSYSLAVHAYDLWRLLTVLPLACRSRQRWSIHRFCSHRLLALGSR